MNEIEVIVGGISMDASKKLKDELLANSHVTEVENSPVTAICYPESKADYRQQIIESYNNCCLCGSELTFTHVADFRFNTVKEEAYCDMCGIRNKLQDHILQ